MTYNNIVNHLKQWCIDKAKIYQKLHGAYGGVTYVGHLIAYELEFKLSTLIDKSFENIADFEREIRILVDIHYEPSILEPQNSLVQHIIHKTNKEFCEFLEDILSKRDSLSLSNMPYERVIVGPEANALQDRFRSVWGYENTSYWFPLMGDEPKEISEKFFIMFDYFEPYMNQFEQLIGLPRRHIYCYGEYDSRPQNCIETVEFIEYGGCETIYTDKDFTWAIYFSHENTVAFVGSIVPMAKELLSKEKEHWNRFKWD